jgi:hypothetical protein
VSAADKWVDENWADARDNTNDVLKLTAMLPNAASVYHDDGGDTFLEILSQLSTKLYCLDMNVGDRRPGYVPPRPPGHPLHKVDELSATPVRQLQAVELHLKAACDKLGEMSACLVTDCESVAKDSLIAAMQVLVSEAFANVWGARWEIINQTDEAAGAQ